MTKADRVSAGSGEGVALPPSEPMVPIPTKLYKYRSFSVLALRMITEAEVFFAQPKTFNDPLDCSPPLDADIDRLELEKVLFRLLQRTGTIQEAREAIGYNRYMSTEYGDYKTEPEVNEVLKRNVAYQVEREIKSQLGGRGVLTFSQTWRSVLMWSHYADEHRGFCIEYDTTDIEHPNLAPVAYGASRAIKASDLFDWLIKEDQAAYQRVFSTFFFSKSSEWKYEKEWREVCDDHGIKNVEYRMSAIHFGMRCDPAVITSIVKLLDDTDEIDLYNVYAKPNSFRLSRTSVDRDEIAALAIREPAFLMFRRFEEDAKPDVTDVAPE